MQRKNLVLDVQGFSFFLVYERIGLNELFRGVFD